MSRADELRAKAEALKAKKAAAEKRHAAGGSGAPAPAVPAVPTGPAAPDEVTQEDRQRHLAPAAPHKKPVRSTVDLAPARHAALKGWLGETAVMIGRSRVTTQDVFRVFVDRLLADETLARKIRDDLRKHE